MAGREHKFQLIGNRFTAILAVCLTGFLAWRDLRAAFSEAPYTAGWLITPLDSFPLPAWGVAAFNVAFYIYVVGLGVWFYRGVQGKERFVVAGFLLGLLGPIKALASPRAVAAIRTVQAVGMGVAFFAALTILLESPTLGKSDAKTAMRLLLFLGAFSVFAFLVGAVLYFTWR
jgi:hypothetical protein